MCWMNAKSDDDDVDDGDDVDRDMRCFAIVGVCFCRLARWCYVGLTAQICLFR